RAHRLGVGDLAPLPIGPPALRQPDQVGSLGRPAPKVPGNVGREGLERNARAQDLRAVGPVDAFDVALHPLDVAKRRLHGGVHRGVSPCLCGRALAARRTSGDSVHLRPRRQAWRASEPPPLYQSAPAPPSSPPAAPPCRRSSTASPSRCRSPGRSSSCSCSASGSGADRKSTRLNSSHVKISYA